MLSIGSMGPALSVGSIRPFAWILSTGSAASVVTITRWWSVGDVMTTQRIEGAVPGAEDVCSLPPSSELHFPLLFGRHCGLGWHLPSDGADTSFTDSCRTHVRRVVGEVATTDRANPA